jgi:hypothetical protein
MKLAEKLDEPALREFRSAIYKPKERFVALACPAG